MALTLEFQTRCCECGQRIPAGQPVESSLTDAGWMNSHVGECPEPKAPAKGQNLPQGFDVEELFLFRKCTGGCMNLWSYRKGQRLDATCPKCGGSWLHGDPEEFAWAY